MTSRSAKTIGLYFNYIVVKRGISVAATNRRIARAFSIRRRSRNRRNKRDARTDTACFNPCVLVVVASPIYALKTRSLAVARIADRTGCQWPSKSSKVDDSHLIWKVVCDFLLVINSNFGSISPRQPQYIRDRQTDRWTDGRQPRQ